MLHALIHMDRHGGALTSEQLAEMLSTNPVVVRRTMAGLREQGYVHSEKGHGGGWALARPLSQITLLDIYRALGEPELFALGLTDDDPQCLVEQAVNQAVSETLQAARSLVKDRFAAVTLADLARDFDARAASRV